MKILFFAAAHTRMDQSGVYAAYIYQQHANRSPLPRSATETSVCVSSR